MQIRREASSGRQGSEVESAMMSPEEKKIPVVYVSNPESVTRDIRTKKSFHFGENNRSTSHVTSQKHGTHISSPRVSDNERGSTMQIEPVVATAQQCDSVTSKPSVIGPQHELPDMEYTPLSEGGNTTLPVHLAMPVRESSSISEYDVTRKPLPKGIITTQRTFTNCSTRPSQLPPHPPPPKLTLSAFRKPEFAVRLTSSPPHKLLHHTYDLTSSSRVLGHGASSTVRLAKHRATGKKVAVKSIGKHDILRRYAHRGKPKDTLDECEILLSLKGTHETIISLLDVYETDSEVQLVLEYCAGGELFEAIQRRRHSRDSNSNTKPNCCDSSLPYLNSTHDKHNHTHRRKRARTLSVVDNLRQCLGGGAHGDTSDETCPTAKTYAEPMCSGYTEAQVARIACQLLSALSHMHGRGIVHRDVKPENIFLVSDDDEDNLTVKLSDFGLARVLQTQNDCDKAKAKAGNSPIHRHTIATGMVAPLTPPTEQQRQSSAYGRVGSDYYAAPEVGNGNGYGTAVDMYSLGVILYILLSGFPPAARPVCGSTVLDNDTSSSEDESDDDDHDYNNHNNLRRNSSPVEFPNRHWHHITPSAKNLVRKMLQPDPSCRISAHNALQHEWIILHLQALQIEVFESPFSSLKKPCRPNLLTSAPPRGSGSTIPVVSFSSVQFDYLASKLFESKKRKVHSSLPFYPQNDEKSRKRWKSHRHFGSSTAIQRRTGTSPSQGIMSVSMVDLYNQVSSIAAAATAAAAELIEDISDSDDSIDIESKLKNGEVKNVENTNPPSSQQENVCFSNSLTPLSV